MHACNKFVYNCHRACSKSETSYNKLLIPRRKHRAEKNRRTHGSTCKHVEASENIWNIFWEANGEHLGYMCKYLKLIFKHFGSIMKRFGRHEGIRQAWFPKIPINWSEVSTAQALLHSRFEQNFHHSASYICLRKEPSPLSIAKDVFNRVLVHVLTSETHRPLANIARTLEMARCLRTIYRKWDPEFR